LSLEHASTDSLVTALDDETLLNTDFLGDTGKRRRIDSERDLFFNKRFVSTTVLIVSRAR